MRRPVIAVAAVAVAAAVVVGVPVWAPVALVVAAVPMARRRLQPQIGDDLPLVADLLASCLAAGVPLPDALRAAGRVAGPALQRRVATVAAALHAGCPPEQAWAPWSADASLHTIARTCLRTAGSGAAAAAEIRRSAARLRAQRRAEAHQRVARASVWVVLPLGLCFLPAFVLVGVVPLALGLLDGLR